jgi:hypothetical protein
MYGRTYLDFLVFLLCFLLCFFLDPPQNLYHGFFFGGFVEEELLDGEYLEEELLDGEYVEEELLDGGFVLGLDFLLKIFLYQGFFG